MLKKILCMTMILLLSIISAKSDFAEEVILGEDSHLLFPITLGEGLIKKLPGQKPLDADGESKLKPSVIPDGAAIYEKGKGKITRVELVSVIPLTGNNPLNAQDPINNAMIGGKLYFTAVDELAQILNPPQPQPGPQPQPQPQPQPSPKVGSIYITSNPSGAYIKLDGQNTLYLTPTIISNVLIGLHTVEVSKTDYKTTSQSVNVLENQTAEIHFNLSSATFASVYINSDPPGAKIWFERYDNYIGETPKLVENCAVYPGSEFYWIRVEKAGYPFYEGTFPVEKGRKTNVFVTLPQEIPLSPSSQTVDFFKDNDEGKYYASVDINTLAKSVTLYSAKGDASRTISIHTYERYNEDARIQMDLGTGWRIGMNQYSTLFFIDKYSPVMDIQLSILEISSEMGISIMMRIQKIVDTFEFTTITVYNVKVHGNSRMNYTIE